MATMTISIAAQTKSFTISPADIARILNAYRKEFGQITVAGVVRDRTDAEVFDFWATRVVQHMKDSVQNIEGAAAQAAVAPVVTT